MLKTCPKCERPLPLTSFYRDRRRPSGRHALCKECHHASARARYRVLKVTAPERAARKGVITEAERERIAKSGRRKTCSRCRVSKLIRHFSAKRGGRYGVAGRCRVCKYAETVAWRRRVKERQG